MVAGIGRLYVLGPPVRHGAELVELVHCAVGQLPKTRLCRFTLEQLEGPARYESAWASGGERRVLRQGMASAELWTARVMWQEALPKTACTVIVMGQRYLEAARGQRQCWQS